MAMHKSEQIQPVMSEQVANYLIKKCIEWEELSSAYLANQPCYMDALARADELSRALYDFGYSEELEQARKQRCSHINNY